MGTWKSHLAYQNPELVAETSNLIFAVYKGIYRDDKLHNDGALFSYSPEDGEIITYSTEDGLNDMGIVQMIYSPDTHALVLVYENANIDLFYGKDNVINIPFIKDKNEYPNKTVNNIALIGKDVYLSTAFGIVVLDLERKEIKETYRLDINTMAVCLWGDHLYAATNEGIKRALISSNLLDKENWKHFEIEYNGNAKRIEKMLVFNDQLVFYDASINQVFYFKEGTGKLLFSGMCRQLSVLNDQLVLNAYNQVLFYTDLTNTSTHIEMTASAISSYGSKNTYWLVQPDVAWVDPGKVGLIGIKKEIDSNEYSLLASGIKINSPVRNYCYYMTHTSGKLLVTGGEMLSDRYRLDGTFMVYENGKWLNFNDKTIEKESGLARVRDFMSAAVDPRDPNHYFVASWGEGLYEFEDTVFVNRYSFNNSLLQTIYIDYYPDNFVRIDGLSYDKHNNLYMVNQYVPNGMVIYTADNKWISHYYPPLSKAHPNRTLITKNNQKWVSLLRLESSGVFVLDDNNTIDNATDDTYYYSNSFVDQQGMDIKAIYYFCLAEDLNGNVWVGTDNGPIYFSSAAQVGEGVCNRVISTDLYGSGYPLLEGQRITTIAVDGGNRKWMGTTGGGVFIVDNSGETLNVENFNTDNSPLFSNNILSIAIDNKTGEVFIGTDKGIISYMNEAIEGASGYSEVYAYPNPVKPADNNQVTITGLMANSTIKITDLAGNIMQQKISLGGQSSWNCTNLSGAIVKAGIYLVFAMLPDGTQGVVTKIMVIK
ncbi:MAG: T9SS type A sorting domain-containing protein [Dysgonamonadaceae bacterium]|nr:T9SS type A sorting domain-containing protein [Dysgonamonadaceae bacterium]